MSQDILQTEFNYMKEEMKEIKSDVKSIQIQLSNNSENFNKKFDFIIDKFAKEYVSQIEYGYTKNKVSTIEKYLIGVVSIILLAVVGAILKLVIVG